MPVLFPFCNMNKHLLHGWKMNKIKLLQCKKLLSLASLAGFKKNNRYRKNRKIGSVKKNISVCRIDAFMLRINSGEMFSKRRKEEKGIRSL